MASIVSRNVPESQSTDTREGLTSWWSRFRSRPTKKEVETQRSSIFNVPLQESVTYANVAISLYNDEGETFIYGYIPIVVAKCGLFLKDNATETEGIFRLSGSAKRIKDLQAIFDQPPKYGKGLDWAGFTVHDAANILRRYLNHLPDPIIPYDWYDPFRQPLKESWTFERTIPRMQELVASLPPLNRQLLLYILDLLAVFASKSDINRMTSENLSAIFQPGLITHPRDDMAPQEYRLSQEVLVFLIDNQSHFLLDSLCKPTQDTAPKPPSPLDAKKSSILRRRTLQTPKHSPSLHQSSSPNMSEQGQSRAQDTPTPNSKLSQSDATPASGLSRSNTVPSKRNPRTQSGNIGLGFETPRHVSSPMSIGRETKLISPAAIAGKAEVRRAFPHHPESSTRMKAASAVKSDVSSRDVPQHLAYTTNTVQERRAINSEVYNPELEQLDVPVPPDQFSLRSSSPAVHSTNIDTRNEELRSEGTSHDASSIANEAEFSVLGGRKNLSDYLSYPTESSSSPQTGPGIPTATISTSSDRAHRSREKTMSSSPSKFSNLFKKKPRNHSISSPSEAEGPRDLDT